MKKAKLFFSAILALLTVSLSAQNVKVSGTVTDASNGDPVIGVAVQLKGSTSTYTLTDSFGAYSISVPSNATLTVSCMGYVMAEVSVGGRQTVDIALNPDSQLLEETIVVAYGTAKREAVTGSVSSVKGQGLAEVPVTSVDKMLSGKLAGVQISMTSGQPGASSQIRVRGTSSINASNAPLWVVDGIPIISEGTSQMTNQSTSIATINPNDIESITVLKDAAAAAVYGSRAANGVILVTTKSGKEGQAQFDARAKYGVSWLQSDSGFRMMTSSELLAYQRDAIRNAGMDPDDPTGTYYRPMSLLSLDQTNWIDHFTRPGVLQEYEISARGGTNKAKYFSSASYHKNDGVFYGIDYSKFQARINADYKLLSNLETGVRINAAYTEQNDVPMEKLYYANPAWAGLTILPWIPKYDENGDFNVNIPTNSSQNPRATAAYDDQWSKSYRLNATMFLRWEITKHLVAETKNSAEVSFTKDRRYWSPKSHIKQGGRGNLQVINSQFENFTTSNTLNYTNIFGGYHSVRALLGQEANKFSTEFAYISAPSVDPQIPYVNTCDQSKTSTAQDFVNTSMLSFFGIIDYNYDNKYFAQLTAREDGSSLFGENNKWGFFWSASASWNISREKWLSYRWLDLLKLRASYGVNGNDGISAYKAYGVYSTSTYNGTVGMLPAQPSNPYLSWEKNGTWNVGVDFGFLGRIRGGLDVYSRKTTDMLLSKKVPQTTGFSTNFMNAGSMKNTGVELQLDGDIISTSDMLWTVGVNIAHNRTKILDLAGDEKIEPSNAMHYVVGRSMYSYYLTDYYGVNPSNGEALFRTEDGTLTNNAAKARKYYAGSPEPKLIGGFNTTFAWKGFSASAFFEFKAGNKVFLVNEWSYLNSDGSKMTNNQMASSNNYWKKPGDNGVQPKPVAGQAVSSDAALSTRWLADGSYLRVKDLTLSYSLQERALRKLKVKGLKFYVSGLNLYCFNDINFWDPEQGVQGLTSGTYPLTKSFVGGIELSF